MLNLLIKSFSILCLLVASLSAYAVVPKSVAVKMQKMGIPSSAVSLYVHEVGQNQPMIMHNANVGMNPASVMKLVTTYSALEILGPAFRWKTEVYRDGEVVNGVLQGNLIIKGYGDPSFKAQDFWRLLMRLKQAGITRITGDLIIDKTYFDASVDDTGTFDNETWRAYNAAPSAFLVNGRNTSFRFAVNDRGQVTIDQEFPLDSVKVVNKVRLKKGGCGSWRSHYTYDVAQSPNGGTTVTFSGRFSEKCGTRYLELSVMNDVQYAYFTFKQLWRELGGEFNGGYRVSAVPAHALKVLSQDSQPLSYIINDINKWSINVMARQVLLTTAAEQHGLPATGALGELAVKNWLASKGLQFKELVIENGSGLSRIERINAKHLGQLLVSAYRSPVMAELMSSMSVNGVDGTAKKRLSKGEVSGRAHLKTGTLRGVSALAGYVLNKQNRRYVMVVLVNHPKTWGAKKIQDAMLEWVYANH